MVQRNYAPNADQLVAPGMHVARISDVRDFQTKGGETAIALHFDVNGQSLVEKLWDSDAARKRQVIFAKRLGLWDAPATDDQLSIEWDQVVNKEIVILVKHEDYNGQEQAKLDYAGIWPLDHEEPKVREFLDSLGQPLTAGAAVEGAARRRAKVAAVADSYDDV